MEDYKRIYLWQRNCLL